MIHNNRRCRKIVSGLLVATMMTMGFAPVAYAAEPSLPTFLSSESGTNPLALSGDGAPADAQTHTLTHGLNFAAGDSAEGNNYKEGATVAEDGYAWDSGSNTLTLGNLSIEINDEGSLRTYQYSSQPGDYAEVYSALVLPEGSTIKVESGSRVDIGIFGTSLIAPTALSDGSAQAGIFCLGNLTISNEGFLGVNSTSNSGNAPLGIYCPGNTLSVAGEGITRVEAVVETESCPNAYGLLAPHAQLTIGPDGFHSFYAASISDGKVSGTIVGTAANSIQVKGKLASEGGDYSDPSTTFASTAIGYADNNTYALYFTGGADDVALDVVGSAEVDLMATDEAVFGEGWQDSGGEAGGLAQNYSLGSKTDSVPNPFVGFGSNGDDLYSSNIIYLGGSFAENALGVLSYQLVTLLPVALSENSVNPASTRVAPGGTASFEVYAQAAYPSRFPTQQDISSFAHVTWEVQGNHSDQTVTDGNVLRVASDETATQLLVIPTPDSTFNSQFPTTPWDPSMARVRVGKSSSGTHLPSTDQPAGDQVGPDNSPLTPSGPQSGSGTLAQTGDNLPSGMVPFMTLLAVLAAGVLGVLGTRRIFLR